MRIDQLPVGSRFQFTGGGPGKCGVLKHLSPGSATVQMDGGKTRTFGDRTFAVKEPPCTVSRASEVRLLD